MSTSSRSTHSAAGAKEDTKEDAPATKQDPDTPGDDTEKAPDWGCPACGRRYEYRQQCSGYTVEQPHPPVEVIPVADLLAGSTGDIVG